MKNTVKAFSPVFVKNLLLVISGTLILAFGTAVFLIPMKIVSGGISGFSIILEELLPKGAFPIDVLIAVLSWGLFLLGLLVLGKDFAFKTLISTLIYPPSVSLFLALAQGDVGSGFFAVASDQSGQNVLVAAIMGGACVGAGCAVTFIGGGSTGGVDVIALIVCKTFKRVKSSVAIFVIDVLPIVLGAFVIKDIIKTSVGIISAFICAAVIDKLFLGGAEGFVAYVVTLRHEEISQAVIEQLDRTTTVVDATGGYSKQNKKLVIVSFSKREYRTLINAVNSIDSGAFVSIQRAHEINGEGWTR